MEALHGKNMLSPEETPSSETDSLDEFEKNLREENIRLLRNLRLQEMMAKANSNDPGLWPFK